MFCSIPSVATNSLGLLVLVVSVLGLHLLDEGDVLLLSLVGTAVGILDGLFPGGLLCLALLFYEIEKVSWELALSVTIFENGVGLVLWFEVACDRNVFAAVSGYQGKGVYKDGRKEGGSKEGR